MRQVAPPVLVGGTAVVLLEPMVQVGGVGEPPLTRHHLDRVVRGCELGRYFWIIGRVDDVIKVSGYRLGSAEIESALVSHPAVAEAAAIGLPHEVKGNSIHTYVILRTGFDPSDSLKDELRSHIGHEIGPIAKPESITFVDNLPKTRSGKIMRRLLKARAQGLPDGDITTLED